LELLLLISLSLLHLKIPNSLFKSIILLLFFDLDLGKNVLEKSELTSLKQPKEPFLIILLGLFIILLLLKSLIFSKMFSKFALIKLNNF